MSVQRSPLGLGLVAVGPRGCGCSKSASGGCCDVSGCGHTLGEVVITTRFSTINTM